MPAAGPSRTRAKSPVCGRHAEQSAGAFASAWVSSGPVFTLGRSRTCCLLGGRDFDQHRAVNACGVGRYERSVGQLAPINPSGRTPKAICTRAPGAESRRSHGLPAVVASKGIMVLYAKLTRLAPVPNSALTRPWAKGPEEPSGETHAGPHLPRSRTCVFRSLRPRRPRHRTDVRADPCST